MDKVQNYFIATLIFILLIAAVPVMAAEIYFETQNKELGIDKNFEVKVFMDTEGESINAIEGEIIFSSNMLSLQQINDGDSFVSLWIKKPSLSGNSVFFSGILPGGYQGNKTYVFSLIFKAKEAGETTIDAKNMQVLKNEPPGSPASVKISPLELQIKEGSLAPEFLASEDKEIPESFFPQIAKDPTVFEGKWFLVFVAQDKGSGIDHYEVLETRNNTPQTKKEEWQIAENPYLLKDQELKSYVYVKAVDKAGNERLAVLSPQNPFTWMEKYFLLIISGIGIMIIDIAIIFVIWKIADSKLFLKKQNKE